MDRRQFLILAAAEAAGGALAAKAGADAPERVAAERRARITTTIDVTARRGPVEIWAPLLETAAYQKASDLRLTGSGSHEVVRDSRYGASMVHARWLEEDSKTLTLTQEIRTWDRRSVHSPLSAAERRFWLQPTASLPTDGVVREQAMQIVGDRRDSEQKVRAIYDWIIDNAFRDPGTRGCGLGDIKNLLESRRLGGKCADLNGLMTGLCRASGVPARDAYGIRFAPSAWQKSLGAAGPDISHAQHCRAEIWLDTKGWFPVDPADVLKVVLEEKAPRDSEMVKAERERLFGSWEMNWAAYNSATDLELPGAPRAMDAHFLMYPYGMTPGNDLDYLDPSAFKYVITSEILI